MYVCLRVKLLHQEREKDQTRTFPPFPFFPLPGERRHKTNPSTRKKYTIPRKVFDPSQKKPGASGTLPTVGSQMLAWIQEKKVRKKEARSQPTNERTIRPPKRAKQP